MMRSPAVSVMLRCSPRDIRDSAAIGSPCVPVVISTTRSAAIISAAAMSIDVVVGDIQEAEFTGDPHVADHGPADERHLAAQSHCGVDDLLHPVDIGREARHDHATVGPADQAGAGSARSRFPTARLPVSPALVESHRNRSTPASPSRDMPGRSVGRPSSGSWSSLMSPVCSTVPAPVCTAIASASGNRVVDREVLALEHTVGAALTLGDLDEHRLDAVLAAFGGDQRQRELRADDRDVATQLEQVRDGADVVLVRVREHQRLDVVEAVLDVAQVGQDQVDAGLVVAREQHPAVDDRATGPDARKPSCCGRFRRSRPVR